MSQDNEHVEADEETGGYGTPTVEQEMGHSDEQTHADGVGSQDGDVVVPSADAEIDESNSEAEGSDEFSSEPGQDAAGLPDGSGNDLPKEKSPVDGDAENFDAG